MSGVWKHGSLGSGWGPFDNRNHEIKVYDHSDPTPRPVVGHTIYTSGFPTGGDIEMRQGALVLSFYSQRNLPRRRGRIFVGPFDPDFSGTQERPSDTAMAKILDLGAQINALSSGTTPFEHVVFSRVEAGTSGSPASIHIVTDYWVNDVWDVIRRRAPKESKRVKLHP